MNGRVDGNYSTRLLVKLQGLGNRHSESGLWDVIHQAWNIKRTLIPPLLFVPSGNKNITNTWKTWKWKVLMVSSAQLWVKCITGFTRFSSQPIDGSSKIIGNKETLSLELVCLILYLSDMSRLSLFYDSMGEKKISFASGNQNHLKELVK